MHNPEDDLSGKELENYKHKKVVKGIAWYSVIASILLFAGFISAYIVSKMDKFWLMIDLPKPFFISTFIIIISSVSLFLALRFAKKNNGKLVKVFLISTLFLGVVFGYFQYKGWKKLVNQGNFVTGGIFYTYGAYGNDFVLLKDGERIEHDGENYVLNGEMLSKSEVESIRNFAFQICGNNRREVLDNYLVEDYNKPYQILQLAKDSIPEGIVEFKDNKAYVNGKLFLAGEQKDLFRFTFGIYREIPFFAIKGKYGEDFAIRLNNETLEFEDKKLYFPEADLTADEVSSINKKVFEGGQEYEIKKGKIFVNGIAVDESDFETFLQLNEGIEVRFLNGKWTRLREELNNAQYAEFYQAGNIASSYVYVFTVMHILHMLIALIVLLIVIKRSFKGFYNAENQLGIQAIGIIWHFLGVLWITLFVILQYFH